ncbi:MAG: hypothetical protein H6721_00755 [Sandaracinus sp.]|nr:hypothetical protein [Sandaracinus sp.]MCB9616284.1 hypothetical protein [Sandaracinus sp.]MCB9630674.1 hypothetical protein [Sandaracinus sp.]
MFEDETALESENVDPSVAPAPPRRGTTSDSRTQVPPSVGSNDDDAPTRPQLARPEDDLSARLVRLVERARTFVRARPLTVVAAVFVTAWLCGYVLGDDAPASDSVFSTRVGGVPVVRARVERVEGSLPVNVGDECVLGVWRVRQDHPTGSSWCRTQLACGGELLYGGDESGFFECSEEGVGRDAETTEHDGDPALDLRVRDGALILSDDVHGARGAFRLEASIDIARAVGAR